MSVYESTAPRGGGVTVAAGLMALVTGAGLFTRPPMAIDEAQHVAVALEMLQRGDWLVPHLGGRPSSELPPLLFWLILAGWKVLGVSELWARLVAPVAGIAALGLVAAMARTLWRRDARTSGWAPMITAGAVMWAVFGSLLTVDTLLACAALLALLGVVHAVEHGRRRGVAFLAAGIALGLLAKGPEILLHVLPAAVLAPWWATPRSDRHWPSWYLAFAGAVLLGVGGALLWAIPAGVAGGAAYRHEIFIGQTIGRLVTSVAHRRESWWYLPVLTLLCFPWCAWPESWRAFAAVRRAPRDAGVRFCVTWALAGLVLCSLAGNAQVHHLLPLVPAVALLLSRGLSLREAAPLARPWLVAVVIAVIAVSVLVLAADDDLARRLLWRPRGPLSWWYALAPLAAAVMLVAWQRGRATRNTAVHVLAVSSAILLASLQLAAAAPGLSASFLAAQSPGHDILSAPERDARRLRCRTDGTGGPRERLCDHGADLRAFEEKGIVTVDGVHGGERCAGGTRPRLHHLGTVQCIADHAGRADAIGMWCECRTPAAAATSDVVRVHGAHTGFVFARIEPGGELLAVVAQVARHRAPVGRAAVGAESRLEFMFGAVGHHPDGAGEGEARIAIGELQRLQLDHVPPRAPCGLHGGGRKHQCVRRRPTLEADLECEHAAERATGDERRLRQVQHLHQLQHAARDVADGGRSAAIQPACRRGGEAVRVQGGVMLVRIGRAHVTPPCLEDLRRAGERWAQDHESAARTAGQRDVVRKRRVGERHAPFEREGTDGLLRECSDCGC